jgi:hypothetical protein
MSITKQILKQYYKNKINENVVNQYSISRKEYYLIKKAIRLYMVQLIDNNIVDATIDDLISLDDRLTYYHLEIMERDNPTDEDIPENEAGDLPF